jgi:hypothetical protein
MQCFITIFLSALSVILYAGPVSQIPVKSTLCVASSEDDCCEEDSDVEDADEDIIIMDEEDTNDDEGVNN